MSARKALRVEAALPPIGCSDKTADRIRAFLASMRPMRGWSDSSDDDRYYRGRAIIERIALSAPDEDDPTIALSPAHCADVVHYLHYSEPIDPQGWWKDPDDSPSHLCGWAFVLQALETSLRKVAQS